MINKNVLVEQLNLGLGMNEICKNLNLHQNTVRRYMKKYQVKLTVEKRGGQNKLINFNPFLPLTNEAYYWLGFLATDGYISKEGAIKLHQSGINSHIIYDYAKFINGKVWTTSNRLTVSFSNKETINFLKSIGISNKKSLELEVDWSIFNGHFLRGIFDGDGSCSTNNIPKITTSSIKFRDQLLRFLNENNIKCNWREKGDKKAKNKCYDVQILKSGKNKFYDLLYGEGGICLERKRQRVGEVKFRELLETPEMKLDEK